MSQVHNVTHVPLHSPLSEACLPYLRAERTPDLRAGRCGAGTRPAVVGGGRRDSGWRQARGGTPPSSGYWKVRRGSRFLRTVQSSFGGYRCPRNAFAARFFFGQSRVCRIEDFDAGNVHWPVSTVETLAVGGCTTLGPELRSFAPRP
jgi:hypothetical protein